MSMHRTKLETESSLVSNIIFYAEPTNPIFIFVARVTFKPILINFPNNFISFAKIQKCIRINVPNRFPLQIFVPPTKC